MRKLALLAVFALVASLIFAATAVAQDEDPQEEAMEVPAGIDEPGVEPPAEEVAEEAIEEEMGVDEPFEPPAEEAVEQKVEQAVPEKAPGEVKIEEQAPGVVKVEGPQGGATVEGTDLPPSGGVALGSSSVLLPVAALLLGSGVLAFAVLRRR